REKIRKFEKENKGIFVEFKPMDKERGLAEIKAAAKIGGLPDIAPIGSDKEILAMGLLESFEEEKENYVPGVQGVISYQNTVYGIPRLINPVIMLLNVEENFNSQDTLNNETLEALITSLKDGKILYNQAAMLSLSLEKNRDKPLVDEILIKGQNSNKSQIKKAIEGGSFTIILCDSMALTEHFHMLDNNSQYRIINFMMDEAYIHGECIAYGIFRQDNPEKLQMCRKLVKELTSEEEQKNLYQYNAFSISRHLDSLYDKNSDMGKLEHGVKRLDKKFINALYEADRVTLK
ncbi:MAG: hypothetical protein WC996_01110, partial [Peptostreptococcales bacterium]